MPEAPRKSGLMYIGVIALWAACMAWFVPQLASLWDDLNSAVLQGVLVFVIICLGCFWFYGIHFWAFFVFTLLERRAMSERPGPWGDRAPAIAVLCPTADDFAYPVALSCVRQEYPNFHVFLLDDSNSDEYRAQVDAFHAEYPDVTTVIRRGTREGFAAGNVNNALDKIGADYDLAAVCDSDNVVPPDFLACLAPYFKEGSGVDFAQASHRSNGLRDDPFVRDLEHLADVRWDYHNLARNRYGMTMCLGHGFMFRTEAWRRAGGFPTIVSQDIAFALAMRSHGYRGLFVPDVVCGEGIPPSLTAWRKSHFRMVTADMECFFKAVVPFVRSKGVSLVERVDAVARTAQIPSSVLFFPFVVAAIFLLPALDDDGVADVLTRWDFLIVNLLIAAGGYLRFVADMFRQPLALIKMLSVFTALQFSLLVVNAIGQITFGLTRRAHFFVTAGAAGSDRPTGQVGFLRAFAALDPNLPAVLIAETLVGLALVAAGAATANLLVLADGAAVLVMLVRHQIGWDWLPGRALAHAIVPLALVGAFSHALGVPGPPGQVLVLAGLSVLIYS